MTEKAGSNRVIRGGSWNNNAVNCRSANRNRRTPDNRNDNLGFRLVSTTLCRWVVIHGSRPCASGQVHRRHPAPDTFRTNNAMTLRMVGVRSKSATSIMVSPYG